MNEWNRITDFYSKPGVFRCESCDGEEVDVDIVHVMCPPATDTDIRGVEKKVKRQFPSAYVSFLKKMNGGVFFTQKREEGYAAGLLIYPCDMIAKRHKEMIKELRSMMHVCEADDSGPWIDQLFIVGEELSSGNYLALDYSRAAGADSPPVIFISHENPFCGSDPEDDEAVLSTSMEGVLVMAIDNPAEFLMEVLGGATSYSDFKTDEQWFPKSYREGK